MTLPQDFPIGEFHGVPGVELVTPGGARATVLLHGGHLCSWIASPRPQIEAREQLYLSPRSSFAAGAAIRGGVPVIFPQFNARGPLQRHGFARNQVWELVSARQEGEAAQALLRLRDDAETRAAWPHPFVLELLVRIEAETLSLDLTCHNSGDASLSFMAALHTYLRIDDLQATRLRGLAGVTYWDSVADTTQPQLQEWLRCEPDMDRIYFGVERDLTLSAWATDKQVDRSLLIQKEGFEDVVVWNPGPEKCAALADMPPLAYRQMLCVEAARIGKPVSLAAGARWTGQQKLTLSLP